MHWGGGVTPWLTCQGTVETATRRGAETSLLSQKLDGSLALADSMQTSARVRLDAIPSADKALQDLGQFAFVALHFFSAGGWQSSSVVEILRLIKRLEELHTEVQGMISSLYLATTLMYYVYWRCSLFLNRYVAASAPEALESPVVNAPFCSIPSWLIWRGGGVTLCPSSPFSSQTWCPAAEGVAKVERKTGKMQRRKRQRQRQRWQHKQWWHW